LPVSRTFVSISLPNLATNFEPTDNEYIAAWQHIKWAAQRRVKLGIILFGTRVACVVAFVLGGATLACAGTLDQSYLTTQVREPLGQARKFLDIGKTSVLTADNERALKPGDHFQECAGCPEMVVVPAGEFMMGSDDGASEEPIHKVMIAKPIAIGRFSVTFDEWDSCVAHGGCTYNPFPSDPLDRRRGRSTRPAIDVTWRNAQEYVAWVSKQTGMTYRLLTEAEWEYAARAGSTTRYPWGDEVGKGNANCFGCGGQWGGKQTSPVGSFKANAFGLYDMNGNVWQWVEDCYHDNYEGAPADGSVWTANCKDEGYQRVLRGGSWNFLPDALRSANRIRFNSDEWNFYVGFRVGRTLAP
jgi:formylglycine-generating enzyme required for sulfatase activity